MQLLKKNQAEPTLKTHKEIESQLFRSASMKKKKRQHCCSPADVFRTLSSNFEETLRKKIGMRKWKPRRI
jgi:hypothetical protein